jgi:hypothetical protein
VTASKSTAFWTDRQQRAKHVDPALAFAEGGKQPFRKMENIKRDHGKRSFDKLIFRVNFTIRAWATPS